LHQDNDQFVRHDTVIVTVGPENAENFKKYWEKNNLPFIGLPDEKHTVLKLFGQEVKLFKFGRQPAQLIIDKQDIVRYAHYGHSMSDIPTNEELLGLLDQLQDEKNQEMSTD